MSWVWPHTSVDLNFRKICVWHIEIPAVALWSHLTEILKVLNQNIELVSVNYIKYDADKSLRVRTVSLWSLWPHHLWVYDSMLKIKELLCVSIKASVCRSRHQWISPHLSFKVINVVNPDFKSCSDTTDSRLKYLNNCLLDYHENVLQTFMFLREWIP